MIIKATIIYTIIDDVLKAIGHQQDKRQKMNDSEVITTALIVAIVFASNIEAARIALYQTGLIPDMLDKSRLCRRINNVSDLIQSIFFNFGLVFICLKEAQFIQTVHILIIQ